MPLTHTCLHLGRNTLSTCPQVAVKTTYLSTKQLQNDSYLMTLSVKGTAELEARLLENLEHPNIVCTYGCLQGFTKHGWEHQLVQARVHNRVVTCMMHGCRTAHEPVFRQM